MDETPSHVDPEAAQPQASQTSTSERGADNAARIRCDYVWADGRRCRAFCPPGDATLCQMHRRLQQELCESEALAAELLGAFQEFKTGTALNHALTKLFVLLVRNRIPVRNAAVLAYIAQLILNTLPTVRKEASLARSGRRWETMVRRALRDEVETAKSRSRPPKGRRASPDVHATVPLAEAGPEECPHERDDPADDPNFPYKVVMVHRPPAPWPESGPSPLRQSGSEKTRGKPEGDA